MQQTSISDTAISKDYTVLTGDLNGYGFMHGGRLLMLADETGFLAANHFCDRDCLTVAVHQARFHRPAYQNEHLILQARVAFTGKTSLWVPVSILAAHDRLIMEAVVVYTAVDAQRSPVKVPAVTAHNAAEHQLQADIICLRNFIRSCHDGIQTTANIKRTHAGQQ